MQLQIRDLTFTYDGSYTPVFNRLNVTFDTSWRLGLVGRNGRGKTTLLRLLMGLQPYSGAIEMPVPAAYFPYETPDGSLSTREVLSLAAPDVPQWRLMRELNMLRVTEDALDRPFRTLSKGEQTKALLCAMFSREDVYPLIDEPTNHLDMHGRALVAAYLAKKDGFLLVSHDRAFLNSCIDHVFSLNRSDAVVLQGNYDTWEREFNRQNEYELARNEDLKRDIKRLEESARRAADWAHKGEKEKFHIAESDVAAVDRGFIGAKSAGMMKRSQNTLRRRQAEVQEKSGLLHNLERVGELKLTVLSHPKKTLVSINDARVQYGSRIVCKGLTFEVKQGDRIALTGANGTGKSSVLKTICGLENALQGDVRLASGLVISYVPQEMDGVSGDIRTFIREVNADETLFKAILRNMDFAREQFDKDLSELSQGQKKKLLIARSLCTPAHLYIWDEPLNYIDVLSRVQIEALILAYNPTLLLVEHDSVFLNKVCTSQQGLCP